MNLLYKKNIKTQSATRGTARFSRNAGGHESKSPLPLTLKTHNYFIIWICLKMKLHFIQHCSVILFYIIDFKSQNEGINAVSDIIKSKILQCLPVFPKSQEKKGALQRSKQQQLSPQVLLFGVNLFAINRLTHFSMKPHSSKHV